MPVRSQDVAKKWKDLEEGDTIAGLVIAVEDFTSSFGASKRARIHLVRPKEYKGEPELSLLRSTMLEEFFDLVRPGDSVVMRRDRNDGKLKRYTWELFQHAKGEKPSWLTEQHVMAAASYATDHPRSTQTKPAASGEAPLSTELNIDEIPF